MFLQKINLKYLQTWLDVFPCTVAAVTTAHAQTEQRRHLNLNTEADTHNQKQHQEYTLNTQSPIFIPLELWTMDYDYQHLTWLISLPTTLIR